MKQLKILGYTDIHHSVYTNGLLMSDPIAVERQVLELAIEHKVDMIVNCGDRFRERNPVDEVKTAADAEMKRKSDAGILQVILVGNHDRWTRNAESGHSYKFTEHWSREMPLVVIAEDRRIYRVELPDGRKVAVHAVPADHELSVAPLEKDPDADFNICIFHNLLIGSLLQNNLPSKTGLSVGVLDKPWLDLVLGGDNHKFQKLPFQNTVGWYLGAAMQHTWGDSGEDRGISIFTLGGGEVSHQFIPSVAPKFLKYTLPWTDEESLESFMGLIAPMVKDQIVRIYLTGTNEELAKVKVGDLEAAGRRATGARQLKILLDPEIPQSVVTTAHRSPTQQPADDFNDFAQSGLVQIGALDPAKLSAMALEILTEIR